MSKITQNIAANILRRMKLKKIRPVDLAERVGCPKSYVSMLLRGKTMPSAIRLWKIARILNTTSDKIISECRRTR